MKNILTTMLLGLLLPMSARAVEYYELEVYGYQTAAKNELEVENTTSFSSDDETRIDNQIMRSSFEFNYGLSDRWETTAYLDYTKPVADRTEFTAFRAHARTHFFEKGENAIDTGAYFELELPRNYRQREMAFEFRPILEKDFSRWTVRLNPQVEIAHSRLATQTQAGAIDPDGDEGPAVGPTGPLGWRMEWGASSSVAYNLNEHFVPHLDWHLGFTDGSDLLLPAIDWRVLRGLNLSTGFGWGLNSKTERRIAMVRVEYEIYF